MDAFAEFRLRIEEELEKELGPYRIHSEDAIRTASKEIAALSALSQTDAARANQVSNVVEALLDAQKKMDAYRIKTKEVFAPYSPEEENTAQERTAREMKAYVEVKANEVMKSSEGVVYQKAEMEKLALALMWL